MAAKLSVRKSSGIIANGLEWAELLPGKLSPSSFRLLNTEKEQDGPVIMKTDQKGTRRPVEGESFFQGEIR